MAIIPICPKCHISMIPEVFSDPSFNPKETGNPYSCPQCKKMYGCKNGMNYFEHVELIKKQLGG